MRSCALAFISVRMFTTIGDCAFAMFRNVDASIGPVIGALFIGGTAIVWAEDTGVRPIREKMTVLTASVATAVSRT